MTLECSECGEPVQAPYRKVCSADCSEARAKKKGSEQVCRWRKANPDKQKATDRHRWKANSDKKKASNSRWKAANSTKTKASNRRWLEANREKRQVSSGSWRKANPDKVKAYNCRWLEANHEWFKNRIEVNIQFRLSINIRRRLYMAIKSNAKSGSAVADLGCSIAELKLHLERQFDAFMNWDNWGLYWHIDHIKPLASFDLTDREQFLRAVHWANLQPLEKIANIRKGARILGPEQALAA